MGIDESKSKFFYKDEIIKILKESSGISVADLPRDIDVSIKNGVLRYYVHNATKNMQEDSAAFEGWIIVLKTWMPDIIKYVELDFDIPPLPDGAYGNPQAGHYNRFLYRLHNMLRLFPEWFFVSKGKREIVSDLSTGLTRVRVC